MNRNWVELVPSAEAHRINRVLYRVQHDRAEEARYFADPAAYLADYPEMADETIKAFAATDIGKLYRLGANPYLLRAYCLQLRVPEPDYLAALRAVSWEPTNG